MTVLRVAATLGVVVLMALVDGAIGGTVAAFWGDTWGCRADDLLTSAIALWGIWHWTGRLAT